MFRLTEQEMEMLLSSGAITAIGTFLLSMSLTAFISFSIALGTAPPTDLHRFIIFSQIAVVSGWATLILAFWVSYHVVQGVRTTRRIKSQNR